MRITSLLNVGRKIKAYDKSGGIISNNGGGLPQFYKKELNEY